MFQDQQEVPQGARHCASMPHQSGHRAYVPTPHHSLRRREIAWGNWCCSTSIWHCFGPRLSKWTITHSLCSRSRRSGFVGTFSLTISTISVYVPGEMPSKLKPFLPCQNEDVYSFALLACHHTNVDKGSSEAAVVSLVSQSFFFFLWHSINSIKQCKYLYESTYSSHVPTLFWSAMNGRSQAPWYLTKYSAGNTPCIENTNKYVYSPFFTSIGFIWWVILRRMWQWHLCQQLRQFLFFFFLSVSFLFCFFFSTFLAASTGLRSVFRHTVVDAVPASA